MQHMLYVLLHFAVASLQHNNLKIVLETLW